MTETGLWPVSLGFFAASYDTASSLFISHVYTPLIGYPHGF